MTLRVEVSLPHLLSVTRANLISAQDLCGLVSPPSLASPSCSWGRFPCHLLAPQSACGRLSARPGSCCSQLSDHFRRPIIVWAATKDGQRPLQTQLSPMTPPLVARCRPHTPGTLHHVLSKERARPSPHGERDLLSKVHGCLLCLMNTGEIGTLGILAEIPGLGWVTCCYLTLSKLLSL